MGSLDRSTLGLVATQAVVHQIETGLKLFRAPLPGGLFRSLRWRCLGTDSPAPVVVTTPIFTRDDVVLAEARCQNLIRHFFGDDDRDALASVAFDLASSLRAEGGIGHLEFSLAEDPAGIVVAFVASSNVVRLTSAEPATVDRRTPGGTDATLHRVQAYLDGIQADASPRGGVRLRGWKRFPNEAT